MKNSNCVNSLTLKLTAIVQDISAKKRGIPHLQYFNKFGQQTPLTQQNFELIRNSLMEERVGDIWLSRAICLLNVAYLSFDNRVVN